MLEVRLDGNRCRDCAAIKPRSAFYVNKGSPVGALRQPCRDCVCAQSKAWYSRNLNRKAETVSAWQAANHDKMLASSRKSYKTNPARAIALTTRWKEANRDKVNAYKRAYREQNPEAVARHELNRRVAEAQASPSWTDRALMRDIYRLSRIATAETGISFVVDHMVPLRNKRVSGLHVHTNLTVILRDENVRKSNRWTP